MLLQELFPLNKRSQEAFVAHFKKEGLEAVANYQVGTGECLGKAANCCPNLSEATEKIHRAP